MNSGKIEQEARVDQFFTVAEARFDRWRSLLQAARAWLGVASQQRADGERHQATVLALFLELRKWEDFFAFPGHAQLRTLDEQIASGDATGTARLAQAISSALLTHSYRANFGDWESEEQSAINFSDRVPGSGGRRCEAPSLFRSADCKSSTFGNMVGIGARTAKVTKAARQIRV